MIKKKVKKTEKKTGEEKLFASKLRREIKKLGITKECSVHVHKETEWYSAYDICIKFKKKQIPNFLIEVKVRKSDYFRWDVSGYRKWVFNSFFVNTGKVRLNASTGKNITIVWVSDDMEALYFLPDLRAASAFPKETKQDPRKKRPEERFIIPKHITIYGWPMLIDFIESHLRNTKMFPEWNEM